MKQTWRGGAWRGGRALGPSGANEGEVSTGRAIKTKPQGAACIASPPELGMVRNQGRCRNSPKTNDSAAALFAVRAACGGHLLHGTAQWAGLRMRIWLPHTDAKAKSARHYALWSRRRPVDIATIASCCDVSRQTLSRHEEGNCDTDCTAKTRNDKGAETKRRPVRPRRRHTYGGHGRH